MIVSLLQIAIMSVLGYDNYLVMRHGASPVVTDDVIAEMDNFSTKDVLGRQRLSCCFCNAAASIVNVQCIKNSLWKCSVVSIS
jgi:ubiquitin-like modifier-activating enzyme ATG7